MSQPLEIVRNSLPAPKRLVLEGVEQTETGIIIRVRGKMRPQCPACCSCRVSYHSHYQRKLLDLPWQGQPVHLHLRLRRFRCRNRQCERKIFAERLPGVVVPKGRETERRCEVLRRVGYALGGLPGSRLLNGLGITTSDDTVLRRVKAWARKENEAKVRVLGVDDWAWRKRQRYGTMLMDLERRRVIDLLPVRSAPSLAEWLRGHPGVEIIVRDRCGLYAEGAQQGAPFAVQITDRYHLMSNLSQAVEHTLQQLQIEARRELTQEMNPKPCKKLTLVEARYQRCRQARYERYEAVVDLRGQGHTQLEIAAKVGLGAETVARWLHARKFPERRIRRDRRRDHARFLQDQERGLHPLLTRTHFSSARITALLLTPRQELSSTQLEYRNSFLRFCPSSHQVRRLALQFRAMLRWRRADRLRAWIEKATGSRFPFLGQFARTLRRDLRAVALAISSPWSNGPMEGHIHRLKVLKRQMYGRAGFELLRARVLPFAA